MATAYKTPGVYIEEIPKFPPSIAPVETAIPAFIGYTQKADSIKPSDLINIPKRIGSIAEYEAYFGVGANPEIKKVTLDDDKNFSSAEVGNIFYMYDSLRLFYSNGGGDCYIVSTGTYTTAGMTAGDFTDSGKGIGALEKVDEPTILVFPDNSLLTTGNDFYFVYDTALAQCASLMDRVGLFHVKDTDPNGADFRSGVGTKDLKYGAAYTPWLIVNFPKNVTYRSFKDVIYIGATHVQLRDQTFDTTIQTHIDEYDQVIADVDTIVTASTTLANPSSTLRDQFTALVGAYNAAKTAADFQNLVNFMLEPARSIDVLVGSSPGTSVTNSEVVDSLTKLISPTLVAIYSTLISYEIELAAEVAGYTEQYLNPTVPSATEWSTLFSSPPGSLDVIPASAANDVERMDIVLPLLQTLFDQINSAWLGGVVAAAQGLETIKHEALVSEFPLYQTILTGIQNTNTAVPPSGAVAGIYAYTDRTRGVWKAPANTSLSGVIGPTDTFTASELDALNVDANSGKSINAIRSFTGKGTLIFGARTLAGNDNEWRYVSVRRFFNFVEESTKKATEQFVFEPNDANTWVRVQAMIENFLTVLWRQGALQGIKPEHAFYVAVGLGKTMTPLDILEGRMIIEIGMAVVRPAEFIILRFSHKMAES